MGRPRTIRNQTNRTISLSGPLNDEADRIPNFSAWVRSQLQDRLDGITKTPRLAEVPDRQLIAACLKRMQDATARTAAETTPEAAHENAKAAALAEALLAYLMP